MPDDPEAALLTIRRTIINEDDANVVAEAADCMHTALSELLAKHGPMGGQGDPCAECYEAWPCDVRDTIATALGGVEA